MSFWDGFIGGLNTRRTEERDYQRRNDERQQELESKIALRLLDDDDPELQEQGFSMLAQTVKPSKNKKGFSGFLGNQEDRGGMRSMLDFARRLSKPGQLQELPPEEGSAALPATSPTTPQGQQGPSMLQQAVQGGAATFGSPTPQSPIPGADAARTPPFVPPGTFPATASEVPGQASFGGIQFGEPGMGNQNAQVPAINVAKIAARVSADKGVPQPGERARLFFPSKARLEGQATRARERGQYEVIAEQLQNLGASPQETKRAIMAKAGAAGGQPNVSNAGYVKLADGRTAQTFTYEEAGMAPRLVMAGPDGGFVPVPPDAIATRMGGIGAGGSQTSRMSVKQAFEYGIIDEEDVAALGGPNQYVSVKSQGDTYSILPATRPSEPFGVQRGSGFAPSMDRSGNPVDTTDLQPVANTRVAAAKALMQSLRSLPSIRRMDPSLMAEDFQLLKQDYPVLRAYTNAQIQALAQADDYLPDAQVERILQQSNPQAKPQSMAPPPGSDPNILAPDWADRVRDQILKQQGRTMTPPPRQ